MNDKTKKEEGVPMKRGKRLKTLSDVRRYLASLINRTENLEVEASVAGRLAYIASILKATIAETDIEIRLKALEEKISRKELRYESEKKN